MKTGTAGLSLIKSFEGLRLEKYRDAIGKWTIGYGHLILPNESFPEKLTRPAAELLLQSDLQAVEQAVSKLVKAQLTQNQFDALVSFAFNVGSGNLSSSTLLKKLNAGDYKGAADEFPKWNKAAGKVMNGLVARRTAERELFLK